MKLSRSTKRCLLGLLLAVGPIAAYALYLLAVDNFHVVSPGQVYRSRQMSGRTLTRVLPKYGIQSLLNLRGANSDKSWYRVETNTAHQFGVKHFDFALSAGREVTDAEIENILAIIRAAPKPVLIHCQAGADRTGLVSALYCLVIQGQPPAQADQQLTIWYGHIPWLQTIAMDHSFWRYVSNHAAPAELNFQPRPVVP